MYDLRKIIIMGNYNLDEQIEIETVVMQTQGMKIENLLYINKVGTISGEKKKLKDEIMSELYDNMYDDDLTIKVKESISGEDAMCKVAKFINKIWDNDTIVYFYDPSLECFDYLKKRLLEYNKDIVMDDYSAIFSDGKDTVNDIYTIMKNNNLKIENLIKDNKISMAYFLHGLVEKLFSK